MKKSFLFLLFCLVMTGLFAQSKLLQAGPMVGYADMREVLLWAQTKQPASVYIKYWQEDSAKKSFQTAAVQTSYANGLTAQMIANQVQPGKKYAYALFINGKEVKRPYALHFQTPPLWQWRTDPPTMKIALGSCAFIGDSLYDRPGRSYGGNYEIFSALYEKKPDMMLWLGDNVYFREADWGTETGIYYRYTHTRSLPEMQPLLANCSNYAIWDDHDYGSNDADRTFKMRQTSLKAFRDFWGNPTYGNDYLGGISSIAEWGDAQFFLIDDRWFRTANDFKGEKQYLGKEQLDWLVEALISTKATFKFVCVGGQVLNPVAKYENMIEISPKEHDYLLEQIALHQIKNVIFLTGDRHHAELSVDEKNGIKIYDWTVSPLTSSPHNAADEANTLRVPNSHFAERNFGIMDISGAKKARKLKLTLFDSKGKELWNYEIQAQ